MDTLTGWLGLEPILPVKVPVTIGIMLNFDGHFDGGGHDDVTCNQTLMGWMGCTPNLPYKMPVTIGTMLNFEGDGHGDVTCKQAFRIFDSRASPISLPTVKVLTQTTFIWFLFSNNCNCNSSQLGEIETEQWSYLVENKVVPVLLKSNTCELSWTQYIRGEKNTILLAEHVHVTVSPSTGESVGPGCHNPPSTSGKIRS